MPKKVLLINPNRMKPVVSPVAVDYLATALHNHQIKVVFLDLAFSENVEEDIKRTFQNESFVAVGITVRNIDDSYFASRDFCLEKTKKIIDLVRTWTQSPVILGGVGFSISPVPALKYCGGDFGFWGEGEDAFPFLIKALTTATKDFKKIPGLIWRNDFGKYIQNAPTYLDLHKLRLFPRDTIDNLKYFQEGGMVGFETKRGCNQSCYYCADPVSKGKKVRFRHPEDVANELNVLVEKGITYFHTCDSEFNLDPDHALQICQEIKRKRLSDKIRWYAYAIPSGFTRELAGEMRKAGCVGIDFGVDSGNELILKNLGRNHTPETIVEVAKICHKNGFTFMFDLLLGGPGENKKTVKETIELMKKTNPSRVGISLGIRIYPGTEIEKMLIKTRRNAKGGFYGDFTKGLLKPYFYLSPQLGENPAEFIQDLISGDSRFFFAGTEPLEKNYNYNDNTILIQAIKKGYRGAFWDILRQLEKEKNKQ